MGILVGLKPKPRICGEHGGEPNSVQFCYRVGLIARLAAAQAAIAGDKSETMRTA